MTAEYKTRKTELDKSFGAIGIIPVIVLNKVSQAEPLGEALLAGGLPVAEITFRSDAALEGIRIMVKRYPQMMIGAGTVLNIEQAKAAVGAGASFLVAPGFNPKVVDYCIENNIIIYPGISGTGDIEQALSRGLDVLKFFPAEALGGVAMLKALSGPYQSLKFIPTGGVDLNNIHSYLALPQVVACGGSWLVSKSALSSGNYAEITATIRESLRVIYGCTVTGEGIEVNTRYKACTTAYLQRCGVEFKEGEQGIEITGKSVILR
jgi:2-dehydro-3-deoxyphosphogluconate aldolase/(4S)-4-hydroxy-2-oxoglutarate aldolase